MKLRRAQVALAISVALHGALLLILARRRPPVSQVPRQKPVAVELQFRAPPTPPAPPARAAQPERRPEEGQDLSQKVRKPSRRPIAAETPKSGPEAPPKAPVASAPP